MSAETEQFECSGVQSGTSLWGSLFVRAHESGRQVELVVLLMEDFLQIWRSVFVLVGLLLLARCVALMTEYEREANTRCFHGDLRTVSAQKSDCSSVGV